MDTEGVKQIQIAMHCTPFTLHLHKILHTRSHVNTMNGHLNVEISHDPEPPFLIFPLCQHAGHENSVLRNWLTSQNFVLQNEYERSNRARADGR